MFQIIPTYMQVLGRVSLVPLFYFILFHFFSGLFIKHMEPSQALRFLLNQVSILVFKGFCCLLNSYKSIFQEIFSLVNAMKIELILNIK